jgi:hypothetical protein
MRGRQRQAKIFNFIQFLLIYVLNQQPNEHLQSEQKQRKEKRANNSVTFSPQANCTDRAAVKTNWTENNAMCTIVVITSLIN